MLMLVLSGIPMHLVAVAERKLHIRLQDYLTIHWTWPCCRDLCLNSHNCKLKQGGLQFTALFFCQICSLGCGQEACSLYTTEQAVLECISRPLQNARSEFRPGLSCECCLLHEKVESGVASHQALPTMPCLTRIETSQDTSSRHSVWSLLLLAPVHRLQALQAWIFLLENFSCLSVMMLVGFNLSDRPLQIQPWPRCQPLKSAKFRHMVFAKSSAPQVTHLGQAFGLWTCRFVSRVISQKLPNSACRMFSASSWNSSRTSKLR